MKTSEEIFWKWFKGFSKSFSFDVRGYLVYTKETEKQLEKAIEDYDKDLGIVIGSENKSVDLIITAYGNSSKFGSASALVKAAPPFDNIKVIALKPPAEDPYFTTDYKGEKINSSEVYFDVYENKHDKRKVGIEVFFKRDVLDKNKFIEIAIIMCESIVGERAYSEYIELIGVGKTKQKDVDEYIPLTQLKAYLDWHVNKKQALSKTSLS